MSPIVSIIVPAYDAAAFIGTALESALAQTMSDLEVLVVDDGSHDATAAIVARRAADEPRLQLLRTGANGGPAKARNLALDAARGIWVAILDADDTWAPDRLERLLEVASREAADVVADDLELVDGESGRRLGTAFGFDPEAGPSRLDATSFIRGNAFGDRRFSLGYLKPLLRRAVLEEAGIRYPEDVRIGEDYQLLLDCLIAGARAVLVPVALYRYRLNPSSISRRIAPHELEALAALNEELLARVGETAPPDLRAALVERGRSLARMHAHASFVEHAKAGALGRVILLLAKRPEVIPLVLKYGRESLLKRTGQLGFHGLRS
jgi:glycosyltransferase involved in cell wall biosynthesis